MSVWYRNYNSDSIQSNFMHIWKKYMTFSSFTHFCHESKSVAIYALYPESFSVKNLAIRKIFAFSDSGASFHFSACTTCAMQKHRRLSKNDFRTWVSRSQMIWSFMLASFPASLLASASAGTQHVCPPILQLGSNPRQPRRKNSSILRASCHP